MDLDFSLDTKQKTVNVLVKLNDKVSADCTRLQMMYESLKDLSRKKVDL